MKDGLITITPADMKQMLTIKVKVARTIAPRLWLCAQVMKLAAWIGGVGISIEVVNETEVKPLPTTP